MEFMALTLGSPGSGSHPHPLVVRARDLIAAE